MTAAPPLPENAVLLLIDVQQGFDDPSWGERNNTGAEARVAALLGAWRAASLPVVHVQHLSREADSPLGAGRSGAAFKAEAAPREDEPIVTKHVNSAFVGTDLEERLRARGITHLVIAGLTTDHCVSTTARMAGNLGFTVLVVEDATATFGKTGFDGEAFGADVLHRSALASLHGEFATVVSSASVLSALPKSAEPGAAKTDGPE